MESRRNLTVSTTVPQDLQALIDHLLARSGGYDPSTGVSFDGLIDVIRDRGGPGKGVIELSPGEMAGLTGMPLAITPVHDALDRLQTLQEFGVGAVYATGIVELVTPHELEQLADIDFEDYRFFHHSLNRLPEPFRILTQALRATLEAHLVVVIPNAFRPDTLVLVVLLGRACPWSSEQAQLLQGELNRVTGLDWQMEFGPLSSPQPESRA